MAAGTKVFLAVAALLVVILVAYYTVNSPEASELAVESPNPPRVDPPLTTPEPRVQPTPRFILPEPEPVEETPPAEELPAAAESEDVAATPEAERIADSLPDHAPVAPADNEARDAGKDAPDEPAAPQPEPTKDDATPPAPPVPPATPAPRPTPPPTVEYTVKEGDTMSSIASDWFGEPGGAAKWDLIAKANPFVDPDRLSVGLVLRLPPKDARRDEIEGHAGSTSTVYVVRSSDTLSRIALAYYGSSSMWRVIYDANRTAIGPNPNSLRVGMKLTIPPAPKPAESRG